MAQKIIDLLNEGQKACQDDAFRQSNLIVLPATGSLIVSGDLHGHRRNFERITVFADLENNPDRHVILQEIIHGGAEDSKGGCLSYELLFDIIRYKLAFINQVHILLGNHDCSFITNSDVMRGGKEMNLSMRLALKSSYPDQYSEIETALERFLFSQPLAVKCENRIWISHSLPGNLYIDKFDESIFNRELAKDDLVKPGSAYLLTWGRNHSQELLDKMAGVLDVDLFVLGHQAQPKGYDRAGENLIIIASDHNHGCLLPIDLTKSYTIEQLIESIVPLASIS